MTDANSNSKNDEVIATISDGTSEPNSQSRLDDLIAQATAKYAVKDYKAAAELYSRATELQAELNGEMSTKNADLLYYYGRCLYHVAIIESDVLGSKVAGESKEPTSKTSKAQPSTEATTVEHEEQRVAEEAVAIIADEKGEKKATETTEAISKPYFQFTGDENFDDSDDEEEGEEGGEGPADNDDELSVAFEVLDLARVLLQRRLDEEAEPQNKYKSSNNTEAVRQLKERLADTHDLQSEISLEGEQFANAVVDLKAALALKQELHPRWSSLIAETHFKLSLALEFASVTQQKNEKGELDETKEPLVDEAMREEAAKEMEAAIASCKLRIEREEEALASNAAANGHTKSKVTRASIDDVKDMVQDMEQRVS